MCNISFHMCLQMDLHFYPHLFVKYVYECVYVYIMDLDLISCLHKINYFSISDIYSALVSLIS